MSSESEVLRKSLVWLELQADKIPVHTEILSGLHFVSLLICISLDTVYFRTETAWE